MKRTISLLVLALCVVTVAAQERSSPPALPDGDGAWTLTLTRSGGFVSSPPRLVWSASSELQWKELDDAVHSATPRLWVASYAPASNPGGCCDQSRFTLELRRRENGRDVTYRTYWYQASVVSRPSDLLRILDFVPGSKKGAGGT